MIGGFSFWRVDDAMAEIGFERERFQPVGSHLYGAYRFWAKKEVFGSGSTKKRSKKKRGCENSELNFCYSIVYFGARGQDEFKEKRGRVTWAVGLFVMRCETKHETRHAV